MAVLVPTRTDVMNLGNQIGIEANFTSIANNDTWAPGLVTIAGVHFTNNASGATIGATYSGGTITFLASAGLNVVRALAIGT